jgi:NADP-dependent 3-hydroxy acid dehydrogenase YdfG
VNDTTSFVRSMLPTNSPIHFAFDISFYLQCLVTGASSGIGSATCEVLSREGAKVIGTGRNLAPLLILRDKGHIVDYVVADLTLPGQCEFVVSEAVRILCGLTTVVNNAGVLKGGAMGSVTIENYHAI